MKHCGKQNIEQLQKIILTSEVEDETQNILWGICHNLDEHEPQERIKFLSFLNENSNHFSCEQLVRCFGYLLSSYFSSMTELEKVLYLAILVDLEPSLDSSTWGDVFELTAIVVKDAPRQMRNALLDLIMRNMTHEVLGSPTNTICICNAFRVLFLEVDARDRRLLLQLLESIKNSTSIEYLNDSISFTIEQLEKLSVL